MNDDNDMVTIDEMMECAIMNYFYELPEDKRKDVIEQIQKTVDNGAVIYISDEEAVDDYMVTIDEEAVDDYMVTIDEMTERAIMNWLDERTETERKEIIERLQQMDDGAATYISDEEAVE